MSFFFFISFWSETRTTDRKEDFSMKASFLVIRKILTQMVSRNQSSEEQYRNNIYSLTQESFIASVWWKLKNKLTDENNVIDVCFQCFAHISRTVKITNWRNRTHVPSTKKMRKWNIIALCKNKIDKICNFSLSISGQRKLKVISLTYCLLKISSNSKRFTVLFTISLAKGKFQYSAVGTFSN